MPVDSASAGDSVLVGGRGGGKSWVLVGGEGIARGSAGSASRGSSAYGATTGAACLAPLWWPSAYAAAHAAKRARKSIYFTAHSPP